MTKKIIGQSNSQHQLVVITYGNIPHLEAVARKYVIKKVCSIRDYIIGEYQSEFSRVRAILTEGKLKPEEISMLNRLKHNGIFVGDKGTTPWVHYDAKALNPSFTVSSARKIIKAIDFSCLLDQ